MTSPARAAGRAGAAAGDAAAPPRHQEALAAARRQVLGVPLDRADGDRSDRLLDLARVPDVLLLVHEVGHVRRTTSGSAWTTTRRSSATRELLRSLWNTVIFSVMTLLGIPLVDGARGPAEHQGLRGVGVYRALYFLPVVTMPAAIALVWKLIYNGDYRHPQPVPRACSASTARTGCRTRDGDLRGRDRLASGARLGYNMVIFLAGMQSIPREFYEAAADRRRGHVRQFFAHHDAAAHADDRSSSR